MPSSQRSQSPRSHNPGRAQHNNQSGRRSCSTTTLLGAAGAPWSARAILVAFLCITSAANADDDDPAVGIRMVTNATTVKQGETFQVDIILTVRGQDSVDSLEGPDTTDFTLLNESESQKASFFAKNGRRSVVVEHRRSLLLRADDAGNLEVGEARAELGEASARAAPIKIKVVGDKKKKKAADDDGNDGDDKGSDEKGDDEDAAGKGKSKEDDVDAGGPGARFHGSPPSVFLEVTPDKDSAYVGEQIAVVIEVWSQVPLGSYPRVPGLKPAGFVCFPLDDGTRLAATQRTLNNKRYYVYPVSRDALFALTPGKKSLPVLSLEVSPAGSFFSRGQEMRVTSPPVSVDVKPLPVPAAEGFVDGNVGAFRLSVSTRPSVVKVAEPFTLVIEASGHGNVDSIRLPALDKGFAAAANVRLFPPTEKRERRDRDGVVAGRVVQEILVQPQGVGDVVVPPLSLVTFWPAEGKYLTSTSAPLTVKVQGASTAKTKAKATRSTLSGAGPRPLHLDVAAVDEGAKDGVVVASFVAAVVAVFVSFVLSLRKKKRASAGEQQRARFAARKRALDDAKDLATLHKLLLDALADRAGDDIRATPHGALPVLLAARGVDNATAQLAADALRAAEAARYSPGAAPKKLKDDVVTVVAALDAAATTTSTKASKASKAKVPS